jgi:hypothetical protein
MSDTFRSPYPGWDVLSKWSTPSYNEQTREVLNRRIDPPAPHALEREVYRTLCALCERVIPQHEDTQGPPPAPIAPWIDAAIAGGRSSGTRYDGMPDTPTAWRRGLAALDAEARQRHGQPFHRVPAQAQDAILRDVGKGQVKATAAWEGLEPRTFLRKVALKQIVEIYYAHPRGQSEIGYGGPASPRGYLRLGAGRIDEWEAPEGQWDRLREPAR